VGEEENNTRLISFCLVLTGTISEWPVLLYPLLAWVAILTKEVVLVQFKDKFETCTCGGKHCAHTRVLQSMKEELEALEKVGNNILSIKPYVFAIKASTSNSEAKTWRVVTKQGINIKCMVCGTRNNCAHIKSLNIDKLVEEPTMEPLDPTEGLGTMGQGREAMIKLFL
jgi:hypothetical protein